MIEVIGKYWLYSSSFIGTIYCFSQAMVYFK